MTEYLNMWKNYVNFSARTKRRGYWMAFLFQIIVSTIIGVIANIISFPLLTSIFALSALLPGIGLAIRRARDAGKAWHIIIPIYNIVVLCKQSKPDDGVPVV